MPMAAHRPSTSLVLSNSDVSRCTGARGAQRWRWHGLQRKRSTAFGRARSCRPCTRDADRLVRLRRICRSGGLCSDLCLGQTRGALLCGALLLAILAGLGLARRMIAPIEALRGGAEASAEASSADASRSDGDDLEALGISSTSWPPSSRSPMRTGAKGRRAHPAARARQPAKSRFLAAANHDLRQPLACLGLFVAQLRTRLESAERSTCRAVETSLAVLNELFDALLDISKLRCGVPGDKPCRFSDQQVLERLGATFAGQPSAKGLALRIVPCSAWCAPTPFCWSAYC